MDFWGSFYANKEYETYLITKILRKHYNVIVSHNVEEADYVFFSALGNTHWSAPNRCVKIFITGENIVPDFNACDYGIGFEWMEYEDRYIRVPLYLFYNAEILKNLVNKHLVPYSWNRNTEKPNFCSFVVSNGLNKVRNEAFRRISQYKHIDSGGRFLNNVGGPVKDKFEFESKHRFSLCFENGSHNGYTTEKLVEALAARTIPIYWGDPEVGKVFNTKAMINVHEYKNMDEVIARIKELEEDEQKYMDVIRQPAFLSTAPSIEQEYERLEKWLLNIFEQPIEKAYRRNRELLGKKYVEDRLKLDYKNNWKRLKEVYIRKIRRKLKI